MGDFKGDWALYELVPFGLEGETIPSPVVTASLAELYCAEISAQLNGPFCLTGYCEGGPISYAIASCLQKLGHDVPLLVLVDSRPSCATGFTTEYQSIVQVLSGQEDLPQAAAGALASAGQLLRSDPDAALAELCRALAELVEPKLGADEYTASLYRQLLQRYRAWLAYLIASSNFEGDQDYTGEIHLFTSMSIQDFQLDWLPQDRVTFREFDSPHGQLLGNPELRSEFAELVRRTGLSAG
ncbi:MAG TPA: thioesterase domain-containing protein [Streptosporangiaceae bacterium]